MTEQEQKKAEQWLKRLQRVMDDRPENCWLYVEGGTINLMHKGENGEHVMKNTRGANQDYIVGCVSVPELMQEVGRMKPADNTMAEWEQWMRNTLLRLTGQKTAVYHKSG